MGAWRVMFLSLGLPGESIRVFALPAAFRFVFAAICMGFKRFLVFFVGSSFVFVAIYMGFKESHFKNS